MLLPNLFISLPTRSPFSYAILSICCFQAVVAVINAMIMCFTPRDDLEKILIKSGTLQAAKQND